MPIQTLANSDTCQFRHLPIQTVCKVFSADSKYSNRTNRQQRQPAARASRVRIDLASQETAPPLVVQIEWLQAADGKLQLLRHRTQT